MMKEQTLSDQIENVLVAIDMVKSIPRRGFVRGLGDWKQETKCGAAYCFGGWVAVHPYFQKKGVEARDDGSPFMISPNGSFLWSDEVAVRLFGQDAGNAFDSAPTTGRGDEKAVVLARLQMALHYLTARQVRASFRNRMDQL